MQKIISRIDKSLLSVENILIILLLSVMVIMAFLQVILRNLFSMGILWADIFLRHLVLWVGFIGASMATREAKHINIDILTRLLSKAKQPYVKILVDIVSAAVCFVLARAGYKFVMSEIEANTILFNNIPAWIFQLIIPVGFALIGFRFILNTIEQIIELTSKAKE
jgi:C4-dicarboxylate transporter DctQ subunit